MKDVEIIEKLADLEHYQWSNLIKLFFGLTLKDFGDIICKWNEQANTDYRNLSEEDKEKDRIWVKKVLKIIKGHGLII